MYKIEYNVVINENGRPCVELTEDYKQRPEDSFFIMELAKHMFTDLLVRNSNKLDEHTVNTIEESSNLIGQLSDEIAKILYDGMKVEGELDLIMNKYQIKVLSINERDNLFAVDNFYMGKIFDRVEGLKVCVINDDIEEIYELRNGITNEHWVKL